MALTPLPDPPQTADPANFATKADALVAALATMVTEINSGGVALTGGTVSTLTVTGVTTLAAGTVGAPSLCFSTDTTTGFYRIGANNVGFAISGVKFLDISAVGLDIGAGGIVPEVLQTVALQNSWVNFGGTEITFGYWKDSVGMVHIQGGIKSGTVTAGTLVFTLPSSYRPYAVIELGGFSDSGYWAITIDAAGAATIKLAPANTFASLNGMSFRAA
ncbi:MAG: hypothetical protein NUV75_01995 [Gallionella sp.]|nr:hypothetical protein [Gallionella sp.]